MMTTHAIHRTHRGLSPATCTVLLIACLLVACATARAGAIGLVNGGLDAVAREAESPDGWIAWEMDQNAADPGVFRSEPYSWKFWNDSGIYQDVPIEGRDVRAVRFGGYLYMPHADALRNGIKSGHIELEFYTEATGGPMLDWVRASPSLSFGLETDTWIYSTGIVAVPGEAKMIRITVRCDDGISGDGVFYVDDLFLEPYDVEP